MNVALEIQEHDTEAATEPTETVKRKCDRQEKDFAEVAPVTRGLASGAYMGTCGGLPVVGIRTAEGRRVAVVTDPDTGDAVGVLCGATTYPALRVECALWLDAVPALAPADER